MRYTSQRMDLCLYWECDKYGLLVKEDIEIPSGIMRFEIKWRTGMLCWLAARMIIVT